MAPTHPRYKVSPERMYGVAAPSIREIRKQERAAKIRPVLIAALLRLANWGEQPTLRRLAIILDTSVQTAGKWLQENPDLYKKWQEIRRTYRP